MVLSDLTQVLKFVREYLYLVSHPPDPGISFKQLSGKQIKEKPIFLQLVKTHIKQTWKIKEQMLIELQLFSYRDLE